MAVLGVPSPVSTGKAWRVLGNDSSIVLFVITSKLTRRLSVFYSYSAGDSILAIRWDASFPGVNEGYICDNIGCGDSIRLRHSVLAIVTMLTVGRWDAFLLY